MKSPRAEASPDILYPASEYPIRFRFQITWNYLGPSGVAHVAAPAKTALIITSPTPILPTAAPVTEPAPPRPTERGATGEGQWEMVIPKMARPQRLAPVRQLKAAISRALPGSTAAAAPAEPSFYTLHESFLSGRV